MIFREAGAICAFVGVLASLFAGYICDQKKCFKEIIKFCSIFFAVTAVIFRIVCFPYICTVYRSFQYLIHPKGGLYDEVVILILCSFLGAFSIPQFPIGVEMGVETTFPVFEATSSGLLVLSGQLCMFAFSFIFWVSRQSNIIYTVAQESAVGNWQRGLLFFHGEQYIFQWHWISGVSFALPLRRLPTSSSILSMLTLSKICKITSVIKE